MNGRASSSCVLVIFGASGDLTHRKLVPALYNLMCDGLLPEKFSMVGFARKPNTDEGYRAEMRKSVEEFSRSKPIDEALWAKFETILHYHQGDYSTPADYEALRIRLAAIDVDSGTQGNRLFYVATPPEVYEAITQNVGGMIATAEAGAAWARIIIEKPFGGDLASARHLNTHVHQYFGEDQIYRIDHYLGKETVQNILVFRFANGIFEPIWNRRYIDHVQITVAETVGVEGRGGYYDQARGHPRHDSEPPAAAAGPDRDGAAVEFNARCGARRKGQGAQGHACRSAIHGTAPCAGSMGRARSMARWCRAICRRRAWPETRKPRPIWR